jgi:hypothetical protein
MHRALPWLALVGCAPPPAVKLGDTDATPVDTDLPAPSISIVYPKGGDTFELAGCALAGVPIVVVVEGLELTEPGEEVAGTGHWHGGPSLEGGYCVSSATDCLGAVDPPDNTRFQAVVGGPGTSKLFVELVDGLHQPLGAEDSVEINLLDSEGGCP